MICIWILNKFLSLWVLFACILSYTHEDFLWRTYAIAFAEYVNICGALRYHPSPSRP